jgi:hypothetical protein
LLIFKIITSLNHQTTCSANAQQRAVHTSPPCMNIKPNSSSDLLIFKIITSLNHQTTCSANAQQRAVHTSPPCMNINSNSSSDLLIFKIITSLNRETTCSSNAQQRAVHTSPPCTNRTLTHSGLANFQNYYKSKSLNYMLSKPTQYTIKVYLTTICSLLSKYTKIL